LNILPVNKSFYVSRVVEGVMDNKTQNDPMLYWDPRWTGTSNARKTTPFKEAIVFTVGGGNYAEYQNIKDLLKPPQQTIPQQNTVSRETALDRKIIYGSTEILTGQSFLKQLEMLGNK